MESAPAGDLPAALQSLLCQQFDQALVVVRWVLVADVMDANDERDVVAMTDSHSVAYEAKALVREVLARHLLDEDDDDGE